MAAVAEGQAGTGAGGARRRLLPAWMQARAAEPRGRGRGAVRHCMNEAELVEVALAVLAQARRREARDVSAEEREPPAAPAEDPGSAEEGEPPAAPAEDPGSAEEWEPPAAPSEDPGSAEGSPGRGAAPPVPPGARSPGWEDPEEDALKYVREIFFS